ncbi:MAG: hypothetical protein U1D97_01590 [Desulfuromonadales bacterium]|nr:hypothetical protein [Desulfuromonadales bacterium]
MKELFFSYHEGHEVDEEKMKKEETADLVLLPLKSFVTFVSFVVRNAFQDLLRVSVKKEDGMGRRTLRGLVGAYFILGSIFLVGPAAFAAGEADSLCAKVKIEIAQELTLERQAFEARMRIHNGLAHLALENVAVTVKFSDEDGAPVAATSDPNDTSALFFLRQDSLENISAVDGTGTVAPSTAAGIRWLIIPAPGAAKGIPQGTLYYVGARLSYTLGGKAEVMEVSPDYIFVKPMPQLVLDYFLPEDVYGDDPFTPEIEFPIPFSLGVRVSNAGQGTARSLKIDSGQPRIVENELGLLIGFAIEGSEVNGRPATKSLKVDFGDIAPGKAGTARWLMTATLSGRFTEFSAEYTHSDELGGRLTSLLSDPVTTLWCGTSWWTFRAATGCATSSPGTGKPTGSTSPKASTPRWRTSRRGRPSSRRGKLPRRGARCTTP